MSRYVNYDPIADMERALARQEAEYEYTLEHGYCRNCNHCSVCPWDGSVGWCHVADEFTRADAHPAEYECDCYEGVAA